MALAIFDLDGTLVDGQSQELLLKYLKNKGRIKWFNFFVLICWFIGYKLGILKNPNWSMEYAVKLLATGQKKDDINILLEDFYNSVLQKRFKKNILDKLKNHQQKEDQVFLLTNAIEPLAKIIANHLGINNVLATKLEGQDIYTGRIRGNIVYGKNKVKILEENFSKKELSSAYAYADHYSDLNFLSLVRFPFLVEPSKRTKKILKKDYHLNNLKIL